MMHRMSLAVLCFVLAGCSGNPQSPDVSAKAGGRAAATEKKKARPAGDDFDKADAWLKSNLDDPAYELVRWWPAKESDALKKERTAKIKGSLASAKQAHEEHESALKQELEDLENWSETLRNRVNALVVKQVQSVESRLESGASLTSEEILLAEQYGMFDRAKRKESLKKQLSSISNKEIDEAETGVNDAVKKIMSEKPPKIARIKIRAKNSFNALRLTNYIFVFLPDGSVEAYGEDNKGNIGQFDAAMQVFPE